MGRRGEVLPVEHGTTGPGEIQHGQPGSYNRGFQRREGACQPCKDAAALRMQRRRKAKRALQVAEETARHRLALEYPEVFARMVQEELRQDAGRAVA